MASKRLVHDLVTSFSTLTPRRITPEELQSLENAYAMAFTGFTDAEIKQAGQAYLRDGEFFPPKPSEILKLIKDRDMEKHNRELQDLFTCSVCHQKVSAISDQVCLDCRGFPILPTHKVQLPAQEPPDYKIESRITCQECGHIGMCIKEPKDAGNWRCRKCYTGLADEQIAGRFRDIHLAIGNEKYHINWREEPPF